MAREKSATNRVMLAAFLLGVIPAAAQCIRDTGCTRQQVQGFVQARSSGGLELDGATFNFTSINIPNLHRIEQEAADGQVHVREPTEFEISDALCSAQQMGGKVVRIYVLSHGDGDDFHVNARGAFGDEVQIALNERDRKSVV